MDANTQLSPLVSFDVAPRVAVGGRRKRAFDIVFATLGLLGSGILFLVVAVVLRLTSRGPVFFRHERVGLNGETFMCLKFRTMHCNADEILAKTLATSPEAREEWREYRKLKNDPRIIPVVGNFLRKTSLDELPQLINVLRGDMSIVGPRPVTPEEIGLYGEYAWEVLTVRPGVTGLWQVSGRNWLTFDQRVALDTSYVRSWSMFADGRIIVRTVAVLLTGQGAY
ncbi:MAG: sugar transferase [Pseudomonadota bacterium]